MILNDYTPVVPELEPLVPLERMTVLKIEVIIEDEVVHSNVCQKRCLDRGYSCCECLQEVADFSRADIFVAEASDGQAVDIEGGTGVKWLDDVAC